jgi:Flp pilus assembly protein TadG
MTTARRVRDSGFVTAETAMALPCLILVLSVLLAVVHALRSELAAQDAAAVGARLAARGESLAAVGRATRAVAPAGSAVAVSRADGLVRVAVTARVQLFGPAARLLPSISVTAGAFASDEDPTPVGGLP